MNESKIGLVLSLIIHLIILLIFLQIYYDIVPADIFSQIEIVDFRIERPASGNRQEMRPVKNIGDPAIRSFTMGNMDNPVPLRVDLPEAYTIEQDPLAVIDTPREKLAATSPIRLNDLIGNTVVDVHSPVAQESPFNRAEVIREQPLDLVDDDYLASLTSLIEGRSESSSAYILEGEILQRNIVYKVIPEYPEGIQKNATVTIRFKVRQDGSVFDIVIHRRDDPIFENVSINALSQWIFNSIPEDKVQEGTITFKYELE